MSPAVEVGHVVGGAQEVVEKTAESVEPQTQKNSLEKEVEEEADESVSSPRRRGRRSRRTAAEFEEEVEEPRRKPKEVENQNRGNPKMPKQEKAVPTVRTSGASARGRGWCVVAASWT